MLPERLLRDCIRILQASIDWEVWLSDTAFAGFLPQRTYIRERNDNTGELFRVYPSIRLQREERRFNYADAFQRVPEGVRTKGRGHVRCCRAGYYRAKYAFASILEFPDVFKSVLSSVPKLDMSSLSSSLADTDLDDVSVQLSAHLLSALIALDYPPACKISDLFTDFVERQLDLREDATFWVGILQNALLSRKVRASLFNKKPCMDK